MNSNRPYGIGGSTPEEELLKLSVPSTKPNPIEQKEFQNRLDLACKALKEESLDALYLKSASS